MNNKLVAIASDHAGYKLKKIIKQQLHTEYKFHDFGTASESPVDYPDYADQLIKKIEDNSINFGILICGSGIGMSIVANRNRKIRAALCFNEEMAELSRKHNDANILVLGSKIISDVEAVKCVRKFLTTAFEGGRHNKRINKLS